MSEYHYIKHYDMPKINCSPGNSEKTMEYHYRYHIIAHEGVSAMNGAPGRGSGRYPLGSGEDPYQRHKEIKAKLPSKKFPYAQDKLNKKTDRARRGKDSESIRARDTVRDLTNEELKELTERKRLEEEYLKYFPMPQRQSSEVTSFVKSKLVPELENVVADTVNKLTTKYIRKWLGLDESGKREYTMGDIKALANSIGFDKVNATDLKKMTELIAYQEKIDKYINTFVG